MDVDRATQGREKGMDARFVGAGGVARESGAKHVEPHIVFRCLDEVSETVQEFDRLDGLLADSLRGICGKV